MTQPLSNPARSEPAIGQDGSTAFVLGTRGSALALHQAELAASLLKGVMPGREVHVQVVSSEGDIDKSSPLTQIGGRGVFTSSLQHALTAIQVDAAVHSSKDVPSLSARGLVLAAFPQREDARDAVVSRHGVGLRELPPNPVVGTSSRRRAVQVLAVRPDAKIADLRGNIDTRLGKAMTNAYDAVILAAAGLTRMGWLDRVTELLHVGDFIPAPGQGALAIETRDHPDDAFSVVSRIDDPAVRIAIEVERAFLRGIGGGCTTPLGAHAVLETVHGLTRIRFNGMLARDDGTGLTRFYDEWSVDEAGERAFEAAQALVRDVRPNRIFGASVDLERQFRGMKVLVTGSNHLVREVSAEVQRRGGEAVTMRTIRIAPPLDPRPLSEVKDGLRHGRFDRVVVTSRNGVNAIGDVLSEDVGRSPWVAAIGGSTAEALRECGIEPVLTAADATGEGLLAELSEVVAPGERILLPVSARARSVIADGLRALGADVSMVTAYETHVIREVEPELERMMARGETGAVLLASPSAVEGFVAQAGHVLPAMAGASFVAIGPVTAEAMRRAGLPVHAMPDAPGGRPMVDALAQYLWGTEAEGDGGSQA